MNPVKEVWIGWVSSLVEAYNMAIYCFIVPLLGPLIFPHKSSGEALFFSYSLCLVGSSIFYPLGALYYGWMGDK